MTPLRQLNRKPRILEIGFGCGHWNKGVGARLLKSYFTNDGGPDVSLFEVDYGGNYDTDINIKNCIEQFDRDHPGVVDKVFFGDQSNATFLGEIVAATGGAFDVIIDDGSHHVAHQRASLAALLMAAASAHRNVLGAQRAREDAVQRRDARDELGHGRRRHWAGNHGVDARRARRRGREPRHRDDQHRREALPQRAQQLHCARVVGVAAACVL
jgi:hypothetical protein